MKKRIIFLTGILLAIGMFVSCATEEFDVEEDLQGTWLCRPTAQDPSMDAWMIMTDDTYELDLCLTGTDTLQDGSSQGALKARAGVYTTTTYYTYITGAWQLEVSPSVDVSSYVLSGSQVTITADWDGPGGNPISSEVFIKQY